MKSGPAPKSVSKGKTRSVFALYTLSILIILAGAALCVTSLVSGVKYTVLTSQVPGAAFGLVILFLGLRYFLSVRKLKAEVYKPSSVFSWSNFRKTGKTNIK
jgi:hypothetical protein